MARRPRLRRRARHRAAGAGLSRLARAGRRVGRRIAAATWRACLEFVDDRGHRDAAQIAFFAVLSFIPLALLLVAACGLVLDDAEVRERVVSTVFDSVPLSQEADRERLQRTLTDALDGAGELGPLTILILLAAATGVTSALRHAINQAWDIEQRPPLLRRKALDAVLALVAILALALAALLDLVGDALELAFTFLVILFLYRVLPMHRRPIREIWPGAVVATVLLALVREAIELYLEELADFGALYGSLGALMALLVFVYAASIVVVFGAEFASEWSRLPDDDR